MQRMLMCILLAVACATDAPPPDRVRGSTDTSATAEPAGADDTTGGAFTRGPTIELSRSTAAHTASVVLHTGSGLLNLRIRAHAPEGDALPMADRLELLRPLLDSVMRVDATRSERDVTVGLYPELGPRMAATALCDERWDPATGSHVSGDPGGAIAQMLGQETLLIELATFFAEFGHDVRVRSAESVLLCDARNLDTAAMRAICPVQPPATARLPCGAQLLFRLIATDNRR